MNTATQHHKQDFARYGLLKISRSVALQQTDEEFATNLKLQLEDMRDDLIIAAISWRTAARTDGS